MAKLFRRSSSSPIERELHASRPAAPPELVEAIAAHTRGRAGAVGLHPSRLRLAAALAISAATVAVFLAFGGIGYAASAASQVVAAVKAATVGSSSSKGKGAGGKSGGDKDNGRGDDKSGHDQYRHKKPICHRTGSDQNPFVLIVVDDSAVPAHLAHGDFFPDDNGKCKKHGKGKGHEGENSPPPTIDDGPDEGGKSPKKTSFSFSDSATAATFEVSVDSAPWTDATSPDQLGDLSDGTHTFSVRANVPNGNPSTPVTRTWIVDATPPPVPTLAGVASSSTTGASASITFADSEAGATFKCRLDSAAFAACTSPQSFTSLADGAHTFAVRALDAHGNASSPTSVGWTVDATPPPAPSITAGPAAGSTSGKSVTFSFADAEPAATFETQLDGSGWFASSSPQTYANLGDGSHTFAVRAVDAYGNTSASVARTWTAQSPIPAPPAPKPTPPPSVPAGPPGNGNGNGNGKTNDKPTKK